MAGYGGDAARVLNKNESERDRRIRLRKEEIFKAAETPVKAEAGGRGGTPGSAAAARTKRDQVFEDKRRRFQQQQHGGDGQYAEPDSSPGGPSGDAGGSWRRPEGLTPRWAKGGGEDVAVPRAGGQVRSDRVMIFNRAQ